MRIVVIIEKGSLRSVLCDQDADVELIDLDNKRDTEQEFYEALARLEMLTREMIEVG